MYREKNRKVHPLAVVAVLIAIIGLGVYWTIRSTQEAVKVTDSITEDAEDQTGLGGEDETVANPVVGQQTEVVPTGTPYPVIISAEEVDKVTVVVNKKYRLPSDYVPVLTEVKGGKMRQEAADALEELFQAAETAGLNPLLISSYRSYAHQEQVYNGYVSQNGQTEADTFSARPGHSEHQTGLAVDVDDGTGCQLETCFGTTAFGQWLSTNAQNYGYIIRYPEGKDLITGYQYEPWHIRYVGKDIAAAVYASGKTLDQYFNIEAGGY